MIDYAKILLPAEVGARLLLNPNLSFVGKFDRATGAVLGDVPCIAEHGPTTAIGRTYDTATGSRALRFTVYPSGRTLLEGSFHKYAQGGANYGDYTFTQFVATVATLCDTFDIDPHTMHLLQLEAGANVIPPMASRTVLNQFVCSGPGSPMEPHRWFDRTVHARKAKRTEYEVKVYDKGRQFGRPDELLRIEAKFTKAVQMQHLGIFTVKDLLDPDAWQRLQTRVIDIYRELFIAEPSITIHSLTEPQRTFLALARTPHYWQELTRGARYKARAKYADIVNRFAGCDLKGDLGRTLDAKLKDLLNVSSLAPSSGDVFTNIAAGHPNHERGRFHGSVKEGNRSLLLSATEGANATAYEVRQCLTCGRDISDQREGSRYCSETHHGTDGKRCRNAGSNPRNNRLRSLERIERDPLLFDHTPFLCAELGTLHQRK